MDQEILSRIELLRSSIKRVIVGQTGATDLLLTSIIADGHVLLEGVPGVAKTLLARYMACLIDADFGRIQFTPDLMPSDILGTEVYNQAEGRFHFHKGPVFAQIVLADEVNRAPAKTQAALFEVMEERQVTVAGKTYKMSPVFTIIATQNPIEQEGTYRLPEAQLDRFMCKINMGYPTEEEEVEILRRHNADIDYTKLADATSVISTDDVLRLRQMCHEAIADEALLRYIASIVAISRQSPEIVLPASPRAAVAMLRMAKAYALINGRDFATPDDVRTVAPAVLAHRLQLSTEAEIEGITIAAEVDRLLSKASATKA